MPIERARCAHEDEHGQDEQEDATEHAEEPERPEQLGEAPAPRVRVGEQQLLRPAGPARGARSWRYAGERKPPRSRRASKRRLPLVIASTDTGCVRPATPRASRRIDCDRAGRHEEIQRETSEGLGHRSEPGHPETGHHAVDRERSRDAVGLDGHAVTGRDIGPIGEVGADHGVVARRRGAADTGRGRVAAEARRLARSRLRAPAPARPWSRSLARQPSSRGSATARFRPRGRPSIGRPPPRRWDPTRLPFVSTSSSTGPSCVTADRRTDARSESPTTPALVTTAVAITTPERTNNVWPRRFTAVRKARERDRGVATTRYTNGNEHAIDNGHEHPGGHRLRRPAPTRPDRRGTRSADRHGLRARRRASRESGSCRLVELVEEIEHLRRRRGVEVAGGLVGPHDPRALHERARAIATRCCSPPDSSSG